MTQAADLAKHRQTGPGPSIFALAGGALGAILIGGMTGIGIGGAALLAALLVLIVLGEAAAAAVFLIIPLVALPATCAALRLAWMFARNASLSGLLAAATAASICGVATFAGTLPLVIGATITHSTQ